ncbi:hypothetical protein N9B72_00310 [Bacteriovoracaceae bacterium]|nr:hypothetical protein [Bacteriovoracaceae bacterium]
MKKLLFPLILILLTSCASPKLSSRDVKKLKLGMTIQETKEVLGFQSPSHNTLLDSGERGHSYSSNNYLGIRFTKSPHKISQILYDVNPFEEDDYLDKHGYKGRQVNVKKKGFLIKKPTKNQKKAVYIEFQKHKNDKSTDSHLLFLQQKERIKKQIRKRLGYKFISSKKKARTVLLVSFGISDPSTTTSQITTPKYNLRYVPAQTATATTNVYGSSGNQLGSIETKTNANNYGTYKNEYAGSTTETVKSTSYVRFMNYSLFSKKNFKTPLWTSSVTSKGSNGDLGVVYPYLFDSMIDIIEKNRKSSDYAYRWYDTDVQKIMGVSVPTK